MFFQGGLSVTNKTQSGGKAADEGMEMQFNETTEGKDESGGGSGEKKV